MLQNLAKPKGSKSDKAILFPFFPICSPHSYSWDIPHHTPKHKRTPRISYSGCENARIPELPVSTCPSFNVLLITSVLVIKLGGPIMISFSKFDHDSERAWGEDTFISSRVAERSPGCFETGWYWLAAHCLLHKSRAVRPLAPLCSIRTRCDTPLVGVAAALPAVSPNYATSKHLKQWNTPICIYNMSFQIAKQARTWSTALFRSN